MIVKVLCWVSVDVLVGIEDGFVAELLAVLPPAVDTLVVVMVLRKVDLAGQSVMSEGHAVAVTTSVTVRVDRATGEEDDEFDDRVTVGAVPNTVGVALFALEVASEKVMGPVRVLMVERELVGRVDVAIDVVAGFSAP